MYTLSKRCTNYAGKVIDWLTVLYPVRQTDDRHGVIWACRCKCGRLIELTSGAISNGRTHSCGKCGYKQQRLFELNAKKIGGVRFGRLVAIYPTSRRSGNSVVWHCKCDCGNECDVSYDQLHKGETVSCGCYHRDMVTKWHTETERLLADRWHRVQQRCYNPTDKNYALWGARGIKMCDEWLHDKSKFIKWAIDNGFKPGLKLDRIDNSKGYSPDNCRWATDSQQANNRTNNRMLKAGPITMSCGQWDHYLGMNPGNIWCRYSRDGKEATEKWIEDKLNGLVNE